MHPAAAHSAGAAGTNWRTDLELHNAGRPRASGRVACWSATRPTRARSAPCSTVGPGRERPLRGRARQRCSAFTGAAALRVNGSAGELRLTSRTFNQGPAGTYGQFIPLGREGGRRRAEREARLIQLSGSADGSRASAPTSASSTSPSRRSTSSASCYRARREPARHRRRALPPYGYQQLTDVLHQVGAATWRTASRCVRTTHRRAGASSPTPRWSTTPPATRSTSRGCRGRSHCRGTSFVWRSSQAGAGISRRPIREPPALRDEVADSPGRAMTRP